jgi:O-antigen/teichoic acid export membrane protein
VNLVVTTVAGFFLTKFFLRHLGQSTYGYWLIASQLLGYAALLDFGVVALLPREVAYAVGSGTAHDSNAVPQLVQRVAGIVLLQIPVVSAVLVAGWFLVPSSWFPLRLPLAALFGAFVLSFPLRIPSAILTGLQDLGFLSWVQLLTWCLGTVVTVLLVLNGWKLSALVAGYVVAQMSASIWALARVTKRFPGRLPRRVIWPGQESLGYLRSAGWALSSQVAQLFVLGTEGIIVGYLFGASTVVPYSMTGRLFSVLGNQPTLVMQAAAPGLAETRMTMDGRARLAVSTALAQGMLMFTACVVIIIIAVNQSFITWWLGAEQYAGLLLTLLFGVRLYLRNWSTTLVYTLFSFGHERRIALIALADGTLTLVLSVLLAGRFGLIGVPLGSIVAMIVTSLPLNIAAIQADTGISFPKVAGAQLWWQWRVVALATLAALGSTYLNNSNLVPVLIKSGLAALACVAIFGPLLFRPPLAAYIRPRLGPLLARLRFSKTGSA